MSESYNQTVRGPIVFISYTSQTGCENLGGIEEIRTRIRSSLEQSKYLVSDFRTSSFQDLEDAAIENSLANLRRCSSIVCVVTGGYLSRSICILEAMIAALWSRKMAILCLCSESEGASLTVFQELVHRLLSISTMKPSELFIERLKGNLVDLAIETGVGQGSDLLAKAQLVVERTASEMGVRLPPVGRTHLLLGSPSSRWDPGSGMQRLLDRIASPFRVYFYEDSPEVTELVERLSRKVAVEKVSRNSLRVRQNPSDKHIAMLVATTGVLKSFYSRSFPLVACVPSEKKTGPKSCVDALDREVSASAFVEFRDRNRDMVCQIVNLSMLTGNSAASGIMDAFIGYKAEFDARASQFLGQRF